MGCDRTVEVAGVQDFCKSSLVLSRIESRVVWRTFNIFQRIIFDTTSLKIFTQFGQHDPDLIQSGWRNGERKWWNEWWGMRSNLCLQYTSFIWVIDKTPVNAGDVNFKPSACGKHDVLMRLWTIVILNEHVEVGHVWTPISSQPEVIEARHSLVLRSTWLLTANGVPHLRGIPTPALFWLVCGTRRGCNSVGSSCLEVSSPLGYICCHGCAGYIHCEYMKMHII